MIYEHRAQFEKGVDEIVAERERVIEALNAMDGVTAEEVQ